MGIKIVISILTIICLVIPAGKADAYSSSFNKIDIALFLVGVVLLGINICIQQ